MFGYRNNSSMSSKAADQPEIKLETAPFDPRFPNQNQTRHCWSSYVDFYRCQRIRGVEYEPCYYFKKVFTSMCPQEWVQRWDDQRENGTFAGKL